MKKRIFYFMILAFSIMALAGCQKKAEEKNVSMESFQELEIKEENNSHRTDEKNSNIGLENLMQEKEYILVEAALLPDSRLLLCYNGDGKYKFAVFDIQSNKILNTSEEIETERLCGGLKKMKLLSDYFYVISENICYVYDFSCQLVKQETLPDKISERGTGPLCWLSDDLNRIAYIKNPNEQGEYLYLSNLDGSNEKQIYEMGAELMVTDLFFSTDNRYLGIEGVTIPKGADISVDCYGYLDLDSGEAKIIPQDDTFVFHKGDRMLIQNKTGEYGSVHGGKVRTFDLKTKEEREIVMKYPDECESANLGFDPEYLVGMHKEEEEQYFSFTIYKNGESLATAQFACGSEQLFTDISSSGTIIELDVKTKRIFLFYYDSDANGYTIKAIEYTE